MLTVNLIFVIAVLITVIGPYLVAVLFPASKLAYLLAFCEWEIARDILLGFFAIFLCTRIVILWLISYTDCSTSS